MQRINGAIREDDYYSVQLHRYGNIFHETMKPRHVPGNLESSCLQNNKKEYRYRSVNEKSDRLL